MPLDPTAVKPERSGWRDGALSARHRMWGYDCPATDIDFLEYDRASPVALIEFKHERAQRYNPSSPNIRACRRLADKAGVPFFVVIRANDFSWFEVNAENGVAADAFKKAGLEGARYQTSGGEVEFVQFLYWLRGRKPDEKVINQILANPFEPATPLAVLHKAWLAASEQDQAIFLQEIAA